MRSLCGKGERPSIAYLAPYESCRSPSKKAMEGFEVVVVQVAEAWICGDDHDEQQCNDHIGNDHGR